MRYPSRDAAERQEVNGMALTRDFRETIVERVRRDPDFARAPLDETATLFLNGEADTARLVLRVLINSTVGFEALAVATAKPAKSLRCRRTLSRRAEPNAALDLRPIAEDGSTRSIRGTDVWR